MYYVSLEASFQALFITGFRLKIFPLEVVFFYISKGACVCLDLARSRDLPQSSSCCLSLGLIFCALSGSSHIIFFPSVFSHSCLWSKVWRQTELQETRLLPVLQRDVQHKSIKSLSFNPQRRIKG